MVGFKNIIKKIVLLSIGVCSFILPVSYAAQNNVFTVGVVPQYEAGKVYSIWVPLLNALEKDTGLKFKFVGSPSIGGFEKSLLSGKFDFAYVNPYQVILSNQHKKFTPLIRDHAKKLQGIIVVKKNSPIKDVSQLESQLVAFPSANALGASLLVRRELLDKHKIKIKPRYVNSHDSVYLNVLLKQFVAGGGVQKTLNKQDKRVREALRVLYKTQAVSAHAFSANTNIKEEVKKKVIEAFKRLSKSEEGSQLLSQVPIKEPGLARISDYAELEKMNLMRFYQE